MIIPLWVKLLCWIGRVACYVWNNGYNYLHFWGNKFCVLCVKPVEVNPRCLIYDGLCVIPNGVVTTHLLFPAYSISSSLICYRCIATDILYPYHQTKDQHHYQYKDMTTFNDVISENHEICEKSHFLFKKLRFWAPNCQFVMCGKSGISKTTCVIGIGISHLINLGYLMNL